MNDLEKGVKEKSELLMKKIIDFAKDPTPDKIVALYNTNSILQGLRFLENDTSYSEN